MEIFLGPFGSGKTEVAINRALSLAASGQRVTFIDLDLVDPFFRARQARDVLEGAGILLVAPGREWDEVDLPLLIPQVYAALGMEGHILIDVGGEVHGALVLRQLLHLLPGDVAVYLVVNPYRPLMRTPEAIAAGAAAITEAAGRPITALVANPHLAWATTAEIVRQGREIVQQAAVRLGVPVVWTAASAALLAALDLPGDVMPLRFHMIPPWEQEDSAREAGSSIPPAGS